jgi:hypothetical protein
MISRYHIRVAMRAIGDRMERRFAIFAGVPYHDPIRRQQWEQLWDTERALSFRRVVPTMIRR